MMHSLQNYNSVSIADRFRMEEPLTVPKEQTESIQMLLSVLEC
jgi:hypothetical protein